MPEIFFVKNYNKNVRVVHNCVDDQWRGKSLSRNSADEKIRFLALGTIEERKAFDIFIHAYQEMDFSYKEKAEIHFAGRLMEYARNYYEPLLAEIKEYKNIYYHGEIKDRVALLNLMAESHVIVVPSKDEACSLVVLEAAMLGKPIIISENIGAKYLITPENGWVFKTDSVESLKTVYETIISNPDSLEKLEKMGEESRKKYTETSTFDIYRKNILSMVEENFTASRFYYRLKHMKNKKIERLAREEEKKNKSRYIIYDFPYLQLEKGSKVVLYAAGPVGQAFYQKNKKEKQFEIVTWADKNPEKCATAGEEIVFTEKNL
jgi:glycosyltransferase involved in cell wall biosynthesis